MSTVEKLLVQIFERKNSIIEQVKQQTDLYSQHLASKLLIEGITPPSWLWNTSLSSDHKELNKDELISEILLPRAWPTTYYPNSRYSICNRTVVTGDNGELSDGAFVETYASSKDLHAGEGPSSRDVYHDNNTEDVLKSIPELDVRVTLPQDETDTRIECTSDAPDQLLAKIQRSKSRQKALKLRNSANTKARSPSSNKCKFDVTSIGIDFSASVSEQVSESCKFPEPSTLVSGNNGLPAERNCPNQENCNDNYTGRVTRSTRRSIKRNCTSDNSKTLVTPCSTSLTSRKTEDYKKCLAKEVGNEDPITSSFAARGQNYIQGAGVDDENFDLESKEFQISMHSFLLERKFRSTKVNSWPQVKRGKLEDQQGNCFSQKSSCENQDIRNASHDNIILTGPEKCDADNQLRNAEADSSKSLIPQSSPSETNGRIGSECLVAELPSDCFMLMNPKQLNFDDMEECNLNEYTHCTPEDENLDIAIKEIGCTPIDHFSLKETLSSSSPHTIFSEKQSTLEQDIYSKSNRLSSCPVEFTTQEPDRSNIDSSDTEAHASKSSLDDPEVLQCFENSNISPEEDIMLQSTSNNSDENHHHMKLSPRERSNSLIEPYVEVGVSGFKRCDEGTAASCASKSKTLVTPCSTSLTSRKTEDYKKCLAKEVANEDPITSSFAARGQNYTQGAGVDDENFDLESKEIQISMHSSLLERKFRSTKVNSWPQVKRRKLEDQQGNCFSASRNSQIPRLCNIKMATGNIDLHSIEGQAGVVLKEDAYGDNSISELCPIMDSCVPGLDLTSIASHDFMVEEIGRGDPVDLTFDTDGCYKPNEQADGATTSNDGIVQVSSESKGTVGDFCDSITEVKGRDVPADPGDSMIDTNGCYKSNEQADAATISNDGILQVLSESKETVGDFCDSIIEVKGRDVPADPGDLTFDTDGWYKQNEQSDAATISNDGILQVSSESKETVGNFCDSIIEVKGRDVSAGPNFDSCEYSNEQNLQTAPMLENDIGLVNNESLCTENIVLKSSSHMMEDSLYPHSLVHSSRDEVESTGIDDSMPIFEGFVIDPPGADGELDIAGVGINFEALDLPRTTIERASILEQICRSASTHKSLSHLSSALKLHRPHTLYQSLPNGLEHLDLRSTSLLNEDIDEQFRASTSCDEEEVMDSAQGISYPDCLGYSGAKFRWKSGSPYASPVGKLWERTSFHSGSSEKQLNSNPELTCFPIKEDSTISEENENVDKLADEIQDDIDSLVGNSHAKRQPLFDVTAEACLNAPASVSAAEKVQAGGIMDSAKFDGGFSGTRNKAKRKLPSHCRDTSVGKENQSLSICATGKKKEKHSHTGGSRKPNLSTTTSLRRKKQKISEKGYNRHNNIVSNVTSFIPLVQQKQAATMCAGKKDIKVKALEAAEAAKRLEEKKEIERKKRKEAIKLERARLEQENLRRLELNKQKKEEERKKKDAEVLARKRARAEEEKNDKEKKRKRIEELRRQQNDQEEKLRARKLEMEKKCTAIEEKAISMKENDDKLNVSHVEKEIGDNKASDKPVSELRQAEILKIDNSVSTISHESLDTSADHSQHEKVIHANLDKPGKDQNFTAKEPQLKSYEISPYKCSDDEDDEDEEDQSMRKFIPSWASKSCVALVLPLQQEIDPDSIFPPESFCSMDEVLLPPRLQQKQTAL